MRIDAVDGDTVENRILKFGSDPTILVGVTRGPQNDHSYFFHDLLTYLRRFSCVYPLLHIIMFIWMLLNSINH